MNLDSSVVRICASAALACTLVASLRAATPDPTPQLDQLEDVVVSARTVLPLDAFVEYPRYESVAISPGGTRLATSWIEDNHDRTVIVSEFPSMKRIHNHQVQPGLSVFDLRWFSDRRLLIQPNYTMPGFRRTTAPLGALLIIDVDRHSLETINGDALRSRDPIGEQRREEEAAARARANPAGSKPTAGRNPDRNAQGPLHLVAVQTSQPEQPLFQTIRSDRGGTTDGYGAFVLNLQNNKQSRVATLPLYGGRFVTGPGYSVALATGTNDQNEEVVYYLPPEARAAGRDWQLAVSSPAGQRGLRPVAWTGSGEEYYALDGRGPTRAVAVWNAQSHTQRILYRHPNADVDAFALDPAGKVWMFSGTDHVPVYWYPDPAHPLARLHQSITQKLPGESVEITSADEALSFAVVRISSGRRTPNYIVMNVKTGASLTGMQAFPKLRGTRLAPVEPVEFLSRDGLTIRGYLTTPTDANDRPRRNLPLIVIAHDGPQGEGGQISDSRYEFERQLFASRGYAVLQVNHRGSPGRGAAFERAGDGRWGAEVQDDIAAGVQWAIRDGVADADRICFYGTHFGGYSALMTAARHPDMFKCVISLAGVHDLAALFRKEIPVPLQQVLGNNLAELKSRSPVSNAASIKAKVLLIQQPRDDYSPTEQFTSMRLALREAGNVPQQETIGQAADGYVSPEVRAAGYARMLKFLEENIGR